MIEQILDYVNQSSGLQLQTLENQKIALNQKVDGKSLIVDPTHIEEVMPRVDSEGNDFLQVNFYSGLKILITEKLIGFKPVSDQGADTSKLPNVVTTPDLYSVFEAIQDAMDEEEGITTEVEALRKVFDAVVLGGEAVGFDLSQEKTWLSRMPSFLPKASA